jgi:hypothetical protein
MAKSKTADQMRERIEASGGYADAEYLAWMNSEIRGMRSRLETMRAVGGDTDVQRRLEAAVDELIELYASADRGRL